MWSCDTNKPLADLSWLRPIGINFAEDNFTEAVLHVYMTDYKVFVKYMFENIATSISQGSMS